MLCARRDSRPLRGWAQAQRQEKGHIDTPQADGAQRHGLSQQTAVVPGDGADEAPSVRQYRRPHQGCRQHFLPLGVEPQAVRSHPLVEGYRMDQGSLGRPISAQRNTGSRRCKSGNKHGCKCNRRFESWRSPTGRCAFLDLGITRCCRSCRRSYRSAYGRWNSVWPGRAEGDRLGREGDLYRPGDALWPGGLGGKGG